MTSASVNGSSIRIFCRYNQRQCTSCMMNQRSFDQVNPSMPYLPLHQVTELHRKARCERDDTTKCSRPKAERHIRTVTTTTQEKRGQT